MKPESKRTRRKGLVSCLLVALALAGCMGAEEEPILDDGSADDSLLYPKEAREAVRQALFDQLAPQLGILDSLYPGLEYYLELQGGLTLDEVDSKMERLSELMPPSLVGSLVAREISGAYSIILGPCPQPLSTLAADTIEWLADTPKVIFEIGGWLEVVPDGDGGWKVKAVNVPLTLQSETSDKGPLYPADLGCDQPRD